MSGIKKLAGQTIWYGASSIAARFLNYLLTPYLTNPAVLKGALYGELSLVYAAIPFLNVLFTYGLETAYFRFSKDKESEQTVYNTTMISLITSTVILTVLMLLFRAPLATAIGIREHPEYLTAGAFIIAFDALTALAFAKLRYEGRPVKFATVRIIGILVNIGLTVFFLSVCPRIKAEDPDSFIGRFYDPALGVGYILLANLVQSFITLLLLSKEMLAFKWKFHTKLWREVMIYTLPLLLAGFGGMINETLDRLLLNWWSSAPDDTSVKFEVGTYSACYKLAILITLSIQAFRMAAEPFFFSAAGGQQPQKIYARVMKFFVITLCLMFLGVSLFLDTWKHFIQNKAFWEGLHVVPVLLLANMFLGIYYNLSIWYKLSNKTMAGAWITLIGAAITIGINYLFIPQYSYTACAWATFFCYGTMMVVSYLWGQKHYPVPYPVKKLLLYILVSVALFAAHKAFGLLELGAWPNRAAALLLLGVFAWLITLVERKELAGFPFVGRFFR